MMNRTSRTLLLPILTLVLIVVVNVPGLAQVLYKTPPAPFYGSDYYVSSWGDDRVCLFDSSGVLLDEITYENLDGPWGIGFSWGDDIYEGAMFVSSELTDEVLAFDVSGGYLGSFHDGELDGPRGILADPLSGIWDPMVCSFNSDEVINFHHYIWGFVYAGSFGSGELDGPTDLTKDSNGFIYVTSYHDSKVVKYSNGVLRARFSSLQLVGPTGIANNRSYVLYVAGGLSNNVVKFDFLGNVLGVITHPDIVSPRGVAFGRVKHLFVACDVGNAIVEFDSLDNYVQTIHSPDFIAPSNVLFPNGDFPGSVETPGPSGGAVLLVRPPSPNPFRSMIEASFVLERAATVTFEVHDVKGRLVRSRRLEGPAGGQQVEWCAR